MGKREKLSAVFCGILLYITAGSQPLFAVEAYVSDLYKAIDVAFVSKSDEDLDAILRKNQGDDNYYLLENYAMKKIRRLLIASDYEFAMKADLVVIDNNLDNTDAVEMYASIVASLEIQQENERLQEEKRQAELRRLEAEKEKQRGSAEKEFNALKTSSGDDVYLSRKDQKYTSTWWTIRFGLADVALVSEADSGYFSARYGICADFMYEYSYDTLMIGFDAGGEFGLLPLSNGDDTMLASLTLAPKVGYRKFSKYLFLRAGFSALLNIGENDDSSLYGDFYTPLVGVEFNHLKAGSAEFSGNVDYYAGHLFRDDLKAALGGALNLSYPFAEMEKVKVDFSIGLKDQLLIKNSGVENRAGIILAIGVENVAK